MNGGGAGPTPGVRGRAWRAISVALAAGAPLAAPAAAATYTEAACSGPGAGGARAAGFFATGAGATSLDDCAGGGGLALTVGAGAGPGAWAGWRYVAPPDTAIAGLTLRRRVTIPADSAAVYELLGSADRCDARSGCGDDVFDLAVPAGGLDFRLRCPASGCGEPGATVVLRRLSIVLRDDAPPVLAGPPAGSLLGGGPVSGARGVTVTADDAGGGVATIALLVDGKARASRSLCRPPFTRAVPCPLHARTTLRVDTAGLAPGPHQVQLIVTDATAANQTATSPATIIVAHRGAARRPRVTLRAGRARLRNGEVLVLAARLPAAAPEIRVAFQVRVGGHWRTFAVRRPERAGAARVRHRFRLTHRRLHYAFRAIVLGAPGLGASPVVGVLVN